MAWTILARELPSAEIARGLFNDWAATERQLSLYRIARKDEPLPDGARILVYIGPDDHTVYKKLSGMGTPYTLTTMERALLMARALRKAGTGVAHYPKGHDYGAEELNHYGADH